MMLLFCYFDGIPNTISYLVRSLAAGPAWTSQHSYSRWVTIFTRNHTSFNPQLQLSAANNPLSSLLVTYTQYTEYINVYI